MSMLDRRIIARLRGRAHLQHTDGHPALPFSRLSHQLNIQIDVLNARVEIVNEGEDEMGPVKGGYIDIRGPFFVHA